MHRNARRILPVVAALAVLLIGWWLWRSRALAQTNELRASGTIEASEVVAAPELAGRVAAVEVSEGDTVVAGQTIVRLDDSLLAAQRAQAEAAHRAALNAAAAARANLELLKAGPTAEQLAVAQTVIDRAEIAADALQETYDNLPEAARDTTNGKSIKQQLDTALATLANAQAQYNALAAGANPKQIEAAQAQTDAAQAQADAAAAAVRVLDVQIGKLTVTAPTDGAVITRAVNPGEVVLPGATLAVIADLKHLRITVYVPEDRYGAITVGEAAKVTVDSFPGESFAAKVERLADTAEFTPRNVQTAQGRKTTVFAVKLLIDNPAGKLKPGMPADVTFEK